ncbi:MAG: helix-turn-helix domain-containing protein [Clostridiales bacterium]|nr:helix-turn-helix domain-containing protein [Clostridiales bacterium]
MFSDLLPAIENGILNTSGAVPVVFEGIEHVLEKSTPVSEASCHDTHELLYLRDGEINFRIEGKKFTLRKGDTVIIRPQMVHALKVTSKQADMLILYFGFIPDPKDLNYAVKDKAGEQKKASSKKPKTGPQAPLPKLAPTSLESFMQFATEGEESRSKDPYFIVSGKYKRDVAIVAERIIEEKAEARYSGDLMLRLLTFELMLTLSRTMRNEWEESLRVKNGKAKELVLIAKNYMDTNYDRGITVNDAASYVYLSQGYFTRAFKDEIGVSPMNYLMNVRIGKACELLKNDDIKVSAIATSVGFASAQRFNVAFKKHLGITPMDYRKKNIRK